MSKQNPLVELINVSKSFKQIHAVDDLSMQVFEGDIYGFLGPNGAGKSTTIRMLLSLVKPSGGQIRLFGKDIAHHRYSTLQRMGSLIEKPDFYNYLSARRNLQILGRLSAVENLDIRINEVLDLVGLISRAASKVKTFSHGMKQRLGIAQTLLHDPEFIILDEPANGLDPQGQKEMRDLITRLNKEQHKTILISSHILSEIEQVVTRMIILNKGKKVVEGSVDDLLGKNELRVTYIVNDGATAAASLQKEKSWKNALLESDSKKLVMSLNNDQIPAVTHHLVDNNIYIYSVQPVRSLEAYFLNLTNHA
ncbi:MAG: ABC transporter ATP-binding protein [Bacteroidota bacterium]